MIIVCTYPMLENHCTRTAQSSHGGCSQQVHKTVYLAVNKFNILVNFFTSENIHRELLSLLNPAVYLLNKIFVGRVIVASAPELCLFLKKRVKEIFAYVLKCMLTFDKMQNTSLFSCTKFEI